MTHLEEYMGQLKGICLIQRVYEANTTDVSGEVLIKSLAEEPYIASFYKPFDNDVEAYRFRKMLIEEHQGYWFFESNYAYHSDDDISILLLGPKFEKLPEEFEYIMS